MRKKGGGKDISPIILTVLLMLLASSCGSAADSSGEDSLGDAGARDSGNNDTDINSDTGGSDDSGQVIETGPVSIAFSVHVENWPVVTDESYQDLVSLLQTWADLFEAHEAHLTFEVKEIVAAATQRGDTVLADLEERGHILGLHIDVGAGPGAPGNYPQLVEELTSRRIALEDHGVTVRHASGICAPELDWIAAAGEAGFTFTTGLVEYCLKSLPEEEQSARIRNCANPTHCHGPVPYDLNARMIPWRTNTASALLDPMPDGQLVILPKVGGIYCMAEGEGPGTPRCTFGDDDIAALAPIVDAGNVLAQSTDEVVHIHFGFSTVNPPDLDTLDRLLDAVDNHVARGEVRWSTVAEHYDRFVAQE